MEAFGSSWNKWDLHIHSKYSLERVSKLEVQEIFDESIKNGIDVISITDHTNFDNLDEAWDIWENKTYTNEKGEINSYKDLLSFLPGIELKADCGKHGVHFIAVFPRLIKVKDSLIKADRTFLRENFLAKINCSKADIESSGDGDYSKGLLIKSVNLELASSLVRSLGGLIIVHNGYKDHAFDDEISHASSNPTEHELLTTLGEKKEELMRSCIDICEFPNNNAYHIKEAAFYWNVFRKPSIICSDSHSDFKGEKFTWIKSEPTLEGLRQILYEPSRIKWGDDEPLRPFNRINSIKINLPDGLKYKTESFCFSPFNSMINFSPFFTCIIGGRGTGKSSLLNILFDSIKEDSEKLELNSNGKRIKVSDYTTVDYNYSSVEYLSQNEIEDFAKNKTKLTDAIFSRLNNLHKEEIEEKKIILDENIEQLNAHLNDRINLYSKQISLLNKQKELKEKQSIIESFQSKEYKELTEKLQVLGGNLQTLTQSKSNYGQFISELKVLNEKYKVAENSNSYDKAISEIIESIDLELSKYKADNFKPDNDKIIQITNEIEAKKKELTEFLTARGLSQENLSDVTRASDEKSKIEIEIKGIEAEIKSLITGIESFDIENSKINCTQYEAFLSTLLENINKEKLSTIKSDYVKSINLSSDFNVESCKEEIYNRFKTVFSIIMEKYRQENNFDESKLKELLTSNLDEIPKEDFIRIIETNETQSKAKSFILYLFNLNDDFYNFFQLIKNAELYNFEKYKLVKVKYDEKEIENTSFGQRCTGALVIILSLGNSPIIIDEPEAHLDSALISNYLVDLIKENKSQRQIIFATHNANFVINGDSELIQILKMDDNNKTIIAPTTIENLETRDELIALEGGTVAFKTREDKYGI